MRLICPNCDAQYEVDAALIPVSGRDVQCSNCGSTWFQGHEAAAAPMVLSQQSPDPEPEAPEAEISPATADDKSGHGLDDTAAAFFEGRAPADDPEPAVGADETDGADRIAASRDMGADAGEAEPQMVGDREFTETDVQSRVEAEAETEATAEDEPTDIPAMENAADRISDEKAPRTRGDTPPEDAGPDEDVSGLVPELPRRSIDSDVLGILRAEADREIAARRAEAAERVEVQDDLGLEVPPPRRPTRAETEIRTARLRGAETDEGEEERRKALLPSIDDVNDSLKAASERMDPQPVVDFQEEARKRRSGFRIGFSTVIAASAAVILIYLYAPQIAAAVPALEPALTAYVDWANGMRLSIDSAMAGSVELLSGMLGDDTGG